MAKQLRHIVDAINSLARRGVVEAEDELFLKKSLKDFEHALSVGNRHKAEVIVNKVCKRLLKIIK